MTWNSIHDPYGNKNGPTKKWGVRGFPTSYLIDHKGVIRYRDLGKKELDQRVAELVAEAEELSKSEKQAEPFGCQCPDCLSKL